MVWGLLAGAMSAGAALGVTVANEGQRQKERREDKRDAAIERTRVENQRSAERRETKVREESARNYRDYEGRRNGGGK
ncbi:hypothetical protein GLAREA_08255 [Glarea lozoyensis ATCC 20868]|uniref:Uncharacterized protein n=1 Tax=Glarea lozoyensis (strain ATCC 20868 / MF5171) TaxID=1116229 RepID=S3DCJ3_GLAL2|nr:uncharacterized protein GLAREA_08255 [Glarea lozoyensis ATCC 20868]EPE24403.1 hypothetical protein GLAREA_08255 [Glarea lozoyensis ATCC 20868]